MSLRRPRTLVSIGAALAFVLVGCFFEPRVPESGGGPVCYAKIPQQEETNVFTNIDGSFRCRQSQSYLEQLSEDFVFVPSASVVAQNPGLFVDPETSWGLAQEQQFVDVLFGATTDTIFADVYSQVEPPQGSSEILFEGDYSFTVVDNTGGQIEYSGRALYTLRQERAIWVMVRWEEQDSESPLGILRAQLIR